MVRLLIVFQAIDVIFIVFAAEENTCSRSAYFVIRENRHLAGHIVKQFKSPSLISCSQSCLRNSWCTFTNFKVTFGQDDEGTCEMNTEHKMASTYDNFKIIDQPWKMENVQRWQGCSCRQRP